jgi:4-amino-4-deoxy-L-arabinose transferase-like glycosyltransferase
VAQFFLVCIINSVNASANLPQVSRAGPSHFEDAQPNTPKQVWFWLAIISLFAFGIRLYWMKTHFPVLSIEAGEYLFMADHLRQSHQLISSYGGPETMYTPFFSIVIAGLSYFGLPVQAAAHTVVLASGTAMVLLLFVVSRYMYGYRAGLRTSLLAAIHPLLIFLSASIYSEGLYLVLWVAAIYAGILALDKFRLKDFLLTGLLFGAAYLTRPEAFAYPFFFAMAVWIVAFFRKRSYSRAFLGSVAILGAYALVAAPYVAYLHRHTGQYRLEGKWNLNYTIGHRIQEGMSDTKASYELGDDLSERGPLMDPLRFATYTPYPHGARDKLKYMIQCARSNWPELYWLLASPAYGSPFLLLFVCLGLFAREWDADRLSREFVLLTMALSVVVLLASAHHLESRYSYPFIPLAIIWSGKGLLAIEEWLIKTFGSFASFSSAVAGYLSRGCTALLLGLLLIAAYPERESDPSFKLESTASLAVKQAGEWLGNTVPPSSIIAAMNSRLPYYGKGVFVQFPYASPETTLRYLKSKKVEYFALESEFARPVPTVSLWLSQGIIDPHVQAIYDTGNVNGGRVKIFRVDYGDSAAGRSTASPSSH